jgi:beta-lactamase regulating signal transducer with metallopeptidase domain
MNAGSMNDLGVTLVWLSLQITALCLVAAAVYWLARRGNPKVGAAATLSALLLISALSVAAFAPGPNWMSVEEAAVETTAAEVTGTSGAIADSTLPARTAATGISWFSVETVSIFAREFERRVQQPIQLPVESWHWTGWLAVLFCLGLGFGSVRLVLGLVSVARLRRSGRKIGGEKIGGEKIAEAQATELLDLICAEFSVTRGVTLCESNGISSAATIGWLRPLVLLPSDWQSWSREELRTVLAHEVAHIAHRDFPCWLLAQVGLLLHFYHPLVHWLAGRLRLEQELAADADAARHSGGAAEYLRNLAELAVRQADRPVAWPARTFLPSRGTLLRRVEMLRDRKANGASPGWRRGVTITAMLLAGILLSGIRQPGDAVAQDSKEKIRKARAEAQKSLAVAQAGKAKATLRTEAKSKSFDLRYVPAASAMLIGARPSALASDRSLQPIIGMLEKEAMGRYGIKVSDVEQVVMVGFQIDENGPPMGREPVVILNLKADSEATVATVVKGLAGGGEMTDKTHNGMKYQESGRTIFYSPNSKTLISGRSEMVTWLMDATKVGPGRHVWAKHFKKVSSSDFVYVLDVDAMKPEIDKLTARARNSPILAAFSPLWEETKLVVVGAGLSGGSLIDLTAVCSSEEGAKKVQQTAQSLVALGKNMLPGAKRQIRNAPPELQKMSADLFGFAESALENMELTQAGNTMRLEVKTEGGSLPVIVALLLPAIQSAREAARRARSRNNLKQIGIAFHNYHEAHSRFPGPTNVGPDGKTVHSWRVALLPFLDARGLHKEYKLDEPWDSENNKKVLAKMPNTFRNPIATGDATHSSYFVLTGADTAIGDGSKEIRFFDVQDGLSNTILAVEAQREIPWTKPEDIPYDAEKDLPKFGGYHKGGFHVVLVDGSVRYLSELINPETLRNLITRSDGTPLGEF